MQPDNRWQFYLDHYSELMYPIFGCMRNGVAFDTGAAEKAAGELDAKAKAARAKAEAYAGRLLHTVKTFKRRKDPTKPLVEEGPSISSSQLAVYLYGARAVARFQPKGSKARTRADAFAATYAGPSLLLPPRRLHGKLTTNEAAIRSLRLAYPDHGVFLDAVLEFRRVEKLASFLSGSHCDADGRMRTQYKQLVVTGRLSSTSNPRGTGMNFQNIDHDAEFAFKPNKGCIFLRCDLSQAEDRVVKVLTGAPHLIAQARLMPWEADVHTAFAAKLFSIIEGREVRPSEITGVQRQLGKRGRHAKNYGMGPKKLAEICLNEKVPISLEMAMKILAAIDELVPEVRACYQKAVMQTVLKYRELRNSWGRCWDFRYDRVDRNGDLERAAYAMIPQSEVGEIMNQWGFRAMDAYLVGRKSQINFQRHDELVISVTPEEAWDVATTLQASLERPRIYTVGPDYPGVELMIPCEWMFGSTASKDKKYTREFKRFWPDKSAFERDLSAFMEEHREEIR